MAQVQSVFFTDDGHFQRETDVAQPVLFSPIPPNVSTTAEVISLFLKACGSREMDRMSFSPCRTETGLFREFKEVWEDDESLYFTPLFITKSSRLRTGWMPDCT